MSEPKPEDYASSSSAQLNFDRLLEQIQRALTGGALILALDEFEALEQAVSERKIDNGIYQFLRSKTQETGVTLVFGGLHTLDEMSRDYQQPFYGSYENIMVSYLRYTDAWQLITNPEGPIGRFYLNFQPQAVDYIIEETGGQPYLIQQICRDAVDHLNHEIFDQHKDREPIVLKSDIEVILNGDFLQRRTVYFDGVWNQTSNLLIHRLLQAMAKNDNPWTFKDLLTMLQVDSSTLHTILQWTVRHDILQEIDPKDGTWRFYVPLMRQWIRGKLGPR